MTEACGLLCPGIAAAVVSVGIAVCLVGIVCLCRVILLKLESKRYATDEYEVE